MKNNILIPVSIIVAGIIIAGALLYAPGSRVASDTEVTEKIDYVSLADDLGLDTEKFRTCVEARTYKAEVEKDYADGVAAGITGTPTTFIGGFAIKGAYPFEAYDEAIKNTLNGAKLEPLPPGIIWPTADDDAVLGDLHAPVTMIVFGDFQCPFCERAFKTSEAQVRKEYVDTGKVKMVYRDFPLSNIHPAATPAAEASECANEQGKYWEYHDALFENQDRL